MANELVYIIIGLVVGFLIAWYIISQQKWKDKADVLKSKWETKFANLEKDYKVESEKKDKEYKVELEKSKTATEKILKEWQVKYIKDIEELKKLFKESEKKIKEKSVSSSRRSLVGKFIEKFVPFLSKIKYAPADMQFLGQPIDYIVFDGLREDMIKKVVFLEVKTGESKLTKREKSLKETIEKRRVSWKEIRVDTESKKTPDKEITEEETTIKELYDKIDDNLKTVRKSVVAGLKSNKALDKKEQDEEPEEYQVDCPSCNELCELEADEVDEIKKQGYAEFECPHCGKDVKLTEDDIEEEEPEEYEVECPKCSEEFTLELEGEDDLEQGVKIECPHCNKKVTITEEDV